jgi:hypothetical protein
MLADELSLRRHLAENVENVEKEKWKKPLTTSDTRGVEVFLGLGMKSGLLSMSL